MPEFKPIILDSNKDAKEGELFNLLENLYSMDDIVLFCPTYLRNKIKDIFSTTQTLTEYSSIEESELYKSLCSKLTATDAHDLISFTNVLNYYLLNNGYYDPKSNPELFSRWEETYNRVLSDYLSKENEDTVQVNVFKNIKDFITLDAFNINTYLSDRESRGNKMNSAFKDGDDEYAYASGHTEELVVHTNNEENLNVKCSVTSSVKNTYAGWYKYRDAMNPRKLLLVSLKEGSYDVFKHYKKSNDSLNLIIELNKYLLKAYINETSTELGKASVFLRNICKIA